MGSGHRVDARSGGGLVQLRESRRPDVMKHALLLPLSMTLISCAAQTFDPGTAIDALHRGQPWTTPLLREVNRDGLLRSSDDVDRYLNWAEDNCDDGHTPTLVQRRLSSDLGAHVNLDEAGRIGRAVAQMCSEQEQLV